MTIRFFGICGRRPRPNFKGRRQHEAIRQQEPPERNWRDGIITANDLQTKTFAPVRIILPGLIPEGVTILAGKPKIGKSWLELDIGLAVAGDRYVLGQTKPVQGDTLYLALEDNQRRLKKRPRGHQRMVQISRETTPYTD